ncbi:MAG: phosphoribosylanthranilate isomerase [Phycisphaeraceae bacterium]
MATTLIKICGIQDADTALAAADAGARWVGLVFVEESPRFVTIEQACAVAASLPKPVTPVGLFVDAHADAIKDVAQRVGLHTVQLHGHEPMSILDDLADLRVIKALPFDDELPAKAEPWDNAPNVDALLIDTPPEGALTGGSGVAFDWKALSHMRDEVRKPIILAGGLTPDNVGEAIRIVRPYAVDVSSGVESSRGVKDVGLIKAFCEAVREADAAFDGQ